LNVARTVAEVREALRGHEHAVSVAAVNGPGNVVISGAKAEVVQIAAAFADLAAVDEGMGLSRAETDGFAQIDERLVVIPRAEPSPAATEVGEAARGADANGRLEIGQRRCRIARRPRQPIE